MNFSVNNIVGTVLGFFVAVWGLLSDSVQWTTEIFNGLSLSHWTAGVGAIGVFSNLYFAWARHRREIRTYEYEVGLREDRRNRLVREEDVKP